MMMKLLLVLLMAAIVLIAFRIWSGTAISLLVTRHISPLACKLFGHRRDGASVRKTERGYLSRCRRCDARLGKESRHDGWTVIGGELRNDNNN